MRVGGKHKGKKSKAEQKRGASPEGQSKSDEGLVSRDRGKEERLKELCPSTPAQRLFTEGLGAFCGIDVCEYLALGDDDEVEKKISIIFWVHFQKRPLFRPDQVDSVERLTRTKSKRRGPR